MQTVLEAIIERLELNRDETDFEELDNEDEYDGYDDGRDDGIRTAIGIVRDVARNNGIELTRSSPGRGRSSF